ncbi:MAG: hypothetical protein QM762_13685 [Chryseolinea sp.]
MGIGFVILLHLVGIGIVSVIVSIPTGLLTTLLSSKERRKQKVFAAVLSPFFAFYTFYFVALFGSIVVSEIKNVDVGIGDSFYVPLGDNCELRFIDLPEYAYIENNGKQIVYAISEVQQVGHHIYGKTTDDKYFSYEIKAGELKKFDSMDKLLVKSSAMEIELTPVNEFYNDRRSTVVGFWMIAVGIIAAIASLTIVYLLIRVIVGYLSFR